MRRKIKLSIICNLALMFAGSLSWAVENSQRPRSDVQLANAAKPTQPAQTELEKNSRNYFDLDATQLSQLTDSFLDNEVSCDGSSATDRVLVPIRKFVDTTDKSKKLSCQELLGVMKDIVKHSEANKFEVAQGFRIYIDINRDSTQKPHYKAIFTHSNPGNASLSEVRKLTGHFGAGSPNSKAIILGAD